MGTPATTAASNGASITEAAAEERLELNRIVRASMPIPIVGETPLIVHNWSQKMRDQLPGGPNSSKKGRNKVEHPTPDEEFESSKYIHADGWEGFPAVGFKAAIVDAYYLFDGLVKKQLKTLLTVDGEGPDQLVRIESPRPPHHREDVVRIGKGTSNLRHRAMYDPWEAVLTVSFLPSQVSPSTIVALVDAAGQGGVGEWRPSAPQSSTGTFGRFHVPSDFQPEDLV